ncbi:MAG: Rid family detoxifying hydrolase [Chloroflexota bacterium]|nr:Rid family detoxifying hydrolase [Chloroflexota bacterium]
MRKAISSDKAPRPRGPYSPAMIADGPTVYVSSQGPIDPATDQFLNGSFADQAQQVFQNVGALLEAAGTSWQHAVKVTIFLADFANFAAVNEVYVKFVSAPYPARTTLQATIGQSAISVDCIAVLPEEAVL